MDHAGGAAEQGALRWLGHATVALEIDGVRVLTDPVLRQRVGPLSRHATALRPDWYADMDVVLISHLHHDHCDLPSLGRLGPATRLVVPRGAGPLLHRAGFQRVQEVDVGDSVAVGPLGVHGVPANHRGFRRPFGPAAPALGYVVEGSRRVYFAGDTDLFPGMAQLGASGLDLALLPVGGWGPTLGPGHLDAHRAASALRLLRPRAAVPIHWGTLWPVGLPRPRRGAFHQPGQAFVAHAARVAPSVVVALLAPGAGMRLSRSPGSPSDGPRG